ncbi:hypothetical protein L2X99_17465 [Microbacterium sp. KUDC0406]|uniref:hypothetical protein n=1 Tax=Microbacterium sp. KUDC0406 TaxID=2909588 RepID=UPI001F2033E4|nr:hypothetical protein [Microbacterium sp. KUDC0406]UJP10110.1 hypothetical protein L2X99_17465 [Microbacterium sp. KUDC0406]
MSTKRLLLALPAAAIAFSLAACSAPARPSVDELSGGIQKIATSVGSGDVFTDAISDCIAKELLDSKVSDGALATIAEGKEPSGAEDQKLITKELEDASKTCATSE